jgi:hypothetical protein
MPSSETPEPAPARDIKRMDIREFRELGFLQEANRLFFHPHGLALEVTTVTDERAIVSLSLDDRAMGTLNRVIAAARARGELTVSDDDLDHLQEHVNTEVRYAPGDAYLSGVWDDRDDPEGVIFGDRSEEKIVKAMNVAAERARHREVRTALFGFVPGHSYGDVEPLDWVYEPEGGTDG